MASNDDLVKVNATAGSGKTHLLVEISKQLKIKSGLYLAYNKSIATEASRKFSSSIECRTTHSLAYGNTVKPFKLKIGLFSYRTITEKIHYDLKCEIVSTLKQFCLSKHTDFDDYAAEYETSTLVTKLTQKYLHQMQEGKIECTHDFYLKYFHLLLASESIEFEPFDILMLDESGDLNEVTLQIFLLLPAHKKIAVGDKYQNIYTFNHTINAFEVLKDVGVEFSLSKSFRVSDKIASRIQSFLRMYIDKKIMFSGIEYEDSTITTRAFIARTNSYLIDKMIELNISSVPYGLVRKASDIFSLPLTVCSLAYQGDIKDRAYKHLQADIDDWHETPELRDEFKTPYAYLTDAHSNDVPLLNAIRLVGKHGKSLVIDTYKTAKSHENLKCNLQLSTAHSCKGLEWDEVCLLEDMNKSIEEIILALVEDSSYELSDIEMESIFLYYVACSRAKKSLINGKYL